MSTARQRPAPARQDTAGPPAWSPADEEWFARLLDTWPPLAEWQQDRLRKLLDLGGDHDDTP